MMISIDTLIPLNGASNTVTFELRCGAVVIIFSKAVAPIDECQLRSDVIHKKPPTWPGHVK
jgi:hypothetical protein